MKPNCKAIISLFFLVTLLVTMLPVNLAVQAEPAAQSTSYSISGRITDPNGNGIYVALITAVPNLNEGIEVLKPILMITGWWAAIRLRLALTA
jgi:hypothetical protein